MVCAESGCMEPREGGSYCRPHRNARQRAWHHRNGGEAKHREGIARYGWTPDDYAALSAAQGGVCAICGRAETATYRRAGKSTVKRLAVDHDHATGAVRGLVCQLCNHLLGAAQDDPGRLRAAIAYLDVVRV